MIWAPQPGPQQFAIEAACIPELMFGGARGGGKSDYLLGDFASDLEQGERWRGILFRRTYPELEELISRSRGIYPELGGEFKESSKTWTFPSGATLRMRYLEREADASRDQGHQYTWLGWDELTQWVSDGAYRMLFACLRSGEGAEFKRIRASANPGGPGHTWVKARFVDEAPAGYKPFGEPIRVFVPSRVADNRILMESDPTYIDRLRLVGSEELVRAWLEGDWSVIEGAYFDNWTAGNVIRPAELPEHWLRFRSMDWGSAKPFSVGWWAVAGETWQHPDGDVIPKGALVRYREWYGMKPGEPNVGLKMNAEDVADGIKERTVESVAYTTVDPSMFIQDGGPSLAERFLRRGVACRKADNKRIPGWEQVRGRIQGEALEVDKPLRPMLYVFNTCVDFIRTVPALQHDDRHPEDLDTDGEDHVADEARYACMSRPYIVEAPEENPPKFGATTFDELRELVAKRRKG